MKFDNKRIIELDVSKLPAPEPFIRIMEALQELKEEEVLKVFHWREPYPLYEELNHLGFKYQTNKIGKEKYEIFIYKK